MDPQCGLASYGGNETVCIEGRSVFASFDGGAITLGAGVVLLTATDRAIDLGYEDLNDRDQLRHDPPAIERPLVDQSATSQANEARQKPVRPPGALRSQPTLRAIALTVSPWRFKSWIKTISPECDHLPASFLL